MSPALDNAGLQKLQPEKSIGRSVSQQLVAEGLLQRFLGVSDPSQNALCIACHPFSVCR